ncbi:MAG: GvpL/GvpF family gas vesicle protein [Candidatus Marinimicrobia bacterium]|nr:GvpL/GvpF family gas vesicle protein [Candidatus Neomarinimicrobiota bacterium]
MINDLIYLYCITKSPPQLNHNMEFKGLKSIVIDNFYVIIKYVSNSEFSEENFKKNISDILWVESNAREHIMVISKVMESGTVIPFKFGTIYKTKTSLKKFITDYSSSLIENFHNIQGKEEWSVKIYCNRKVLSEQIDELSEETATLEKKIMASSPGKAFLFKRKKEDLIETEMNRLNNSYGQEYYDEFKNLSESTRLNNLLPKEFTGTENTMILNATFLVSKNRVNDFKSTVDKLIKKDEKFCFIIEATGPWPPFSFISIKEKQ